MKHLHVCDQTTVDELLRRLETQTAVDLATSLAYPTRFAKAISEIIHLRPGAVGASRENELRARLGMTPHTGNGQVTRFMYDPPPERYVLVFTLPDEPKDPYAAFLEDKVRQLEHSLRQRQAGKG